MADNVAITPGVGANIAADDVGSVYFQKIKLDAGGDGASVPIVAGQQTMAASVPVVLASDQSALPIADGGGALTVDGTVTANQGAAHATLPWKVEGVAGGVAQPVSMATAPALVAGTAVIGKLATPSFAESDSLTRPANTTPYAANRSINCTVAVTAMAYDGLTVTLTANNAFAVGDRITVAGVNAGFTVTNIDGNWTCKTGTNGTTVVFDVTDQPVGATPQTITVGTIAKCLSLDVAGVVGGGVVLSRLSVTLPGATMIGAVRVYAYTVQPTVLVDQEVFTLLAANDANRRSYFDLYPATEGAGSDVAVAEWTGWKVIKCVPGDTRLYFRVAAEGAGTPTSAGVVTLRASGLQTLG